MCPNSKTPPLPKRCKSPISGFSLPAALFILVILSMLAAVIYRTVAIGNTSVALEVLTARAFLAAESGAHAQMMRVFPVSGGGTCANLSLTLTNAGFYDCTITTTCNTIVADAQTVFPITSRAECKAGPLKASRTLEVMAK